MKRQVILSAAACLLAGLPLAMLAQWPSPDIEAKPGSRWWWLGSAVDRENLTYNLETYSRAGMGTMEITPIYGVQGNDAADIPFLSPEWMEVYRHTVDTARGNGMQIDMNTGTGWPFGGPEVEIGDAACRLVVAEWDISGGRKVGLDIVPGDADQAGVVVLERLMAFSAGGACLDLTPSVAGGRLSWKAPKGDWHLVAAFSGKTFQAVKRAAPGGEGYVMDHFSHGAVERYLGRFSRAFGEAGAPAPHLFFNDSYEVYGADWTTGLFDEFLARRGYRLEEHLPEFLSAEPSDASRRIVSDYRETLSDLLLENFTRQWTDWAHGMGSGTRNQAHGSPGNLIDIYAAVDVPECEGFGLTDFGIRGLRRDSLTHPNFSDLSMLKYASSAAHITGKPYTSSETFTWLTEHFRTSLSQCKPDLDLMFVSGVNHVFFHGTAYSPKDDPWPGWRFYASIDMSPANSMWKAAPSFFDYIARCQGFLQMGEPDNDFLLYLPIYDMWHEQPGRLLMFDIHKMEERAPRFIEAVRKITEAGYGVDYISDSFIMQAGCRDGKVLTAGGRSYKAIVVPGARLMPEGTLAKLLALADEGATVVFLDRYPEDVPGYGNLDERRAAFNGLLESLKAGRGGVIFGTDYPEVLSRTGVVPETLKRDFSLSHIRRSNEGGHHYFLSALSPVDVDGWVPLAVEARSAVLYDPMDGSFGKIPIRKAGRGVEAYLQLRSGQSAIVRTYEDEDVDVVERPVYAAAGEPVELGPEWGFSFVEGEPRVSGAPGRVTLGSWTSLGMENASTTMGTALYSTRFNVDTDAAEWLLSLGDVRESALLRVNGKEVGTLWALPYECMVGEYLVRGENLLEVEVTNLPANRIAEMDRQGIPWRKFKEINVVNLDYKTDGYGHWEPMESGLLGPVTLTPMGIVVPD